jgi:hypothetical protein
MRSRVREGIRPEDGISTWETEQRMDWPDRGAVMMGIIQGKTGVNIHGLDGVLDMDVCYVTPRSHACMTG